LRQFIRNIFRKKTGLFIDPYFSATKIKWILDNVKVSKKLLKTNNLLKFKRKKKTYN